MGIIKYKGEIIYEGLIAQVEVRSNWCDSMAEYYPYLVVSSVDPISSEINHKVLRPDIHISWPTGNDLNYAVDQENLNELNYILDRKKKLEEAKKITYHKLVKVVRGRKVPIGTEGEIMWMGNNGFGPTVGIRLLDGKVVFTSQKNVQAVTIDEEFENIILKT